MKRRPPRSTHCISSAASDVYKRQATHLKESGGKETNGLSSSYDHFILDSSETKECATASGKVRVGRINTYTGEAGKYIASNYIIRKKDSMTEAKNGEAKRKKHLNRFRKHLKGIKTIKSGKIQWDDYEYDAKIKAYEERVFFSQLKNKTYHKVQQEILSDHMPITLKCSTK